MAVHLRPNGKVLIWWSPDFEPLRPPCSPLCADPVDACVRIGSGHPETCSKIVNLPQFVPPYWDLDERGNKLDRFAQPPAAQFLNKLTIAEFERLGAANRLNFARREFHSFRALKRMPLVETLVTRPGLREFFSSYVVYELLAASR